MTRDEARAAFAASGFTYAVLTRANLEALRQRIDAEMKSSGLMGGSYRMRKICRVPNEKMPWASLRCKAHYFDDREAVTFNRDGFVGFAGWADDQNVQPVLAGFISWVATPQDSTP